MEKGVILSSFSMGYLFSPIGGIIATKYGGTKTFGCGIMSAGILTILSPFIIRTHFSMYIVARVFEGVFEVRFLN